MKRLAKILGIVIAVIVVLIVAAAIILPLVFDPNQHKPEITAMIEQRIGRQVTIPGDIELSVFPWLGVSIGKVTVANAPGFGDEPLAAVAAADVRVKLLPLLQRQVQIGTVSLQGLRLRLARNAKGQTNWGGIVAHLQGADADQTQQPRQQQPTTTAQDGGFDLTSLQVGAVAIEDASIAWNDATTGNSYKLSHFYLKTGALAEDQPVDVQAGATLAAATQGLTATLAMSATVDPDISAEIYGLANLDIELQASGKAIPAGKQKVRLTGSGVLNLAAGEFGLKDLQLQMAGLQVAANVSGQQLDTAPRISADFDVADFDVATVLANLGMTDVLPGVTGSAALTGSAMLDMGSGKFALKDLRIDALGLAAQASIDGTGWNKTPAFTGTLQVAQFNPRAVLAKLGLELPQLQSQQVLQQAALELSFAGAPDSASIDQLRLTLDDSVFTGTASVDGFVTPKIAFDANVNAFNLDNYLPAASAEKASGEASSGSTTTGGGAAPAIDLSFLKGLTLDGKLHVGTLTAYDMTFNDAALAVMARGGVLTIKPLASGFYDGNINVVATVDASGKVPQYALQADLAKLKFAPLLEDLVGTDVVSALASLKLDLTSSGATVDAIKQALDGNVSFDLSDGTFYGFNLAHLIAVAKSRVLGGAAPQLSGKQSTPFSHFAGSFDINNGVLSGDGLTLTTKYLGAAGAGQYNLLANNLDYNLKVHVDDKNAGPLAEVAGLTVPIHLSGSLLSPQYSIDIKTLLQSLAKQHLRDEKAELKQKLSDKLSEKLGDKAADKLGGKLNKKLQEGLSDLFN